MPEPSLIWIALGILVIAFLYSSVGHAGASGYIAVMSLFGIAATTIKPVALVLNILVASIGTWQYYRAGFFRWRLFWPFAVLSIPLAFLGGYINLPVRTFKLLVGLVLLASAARFFLKPGEDPEPTTPPLPVAIGTGGALGFLAGLTGTGGGIFLTPTMVFLKWAKVKNASAVSALFILVNSVAGLLGNLRATRSFPAFAWVLLLSAGCGGALGSYLGSQRFPQALIKRLLGVVLAIAGLKLIFT
jgi:uncharacterized membrane protein YfcA